MEENLNKCECACEEEVAMSGKMNSIKTVMNQLFDQHLKGVKIPRRMSSPVLRKYDGKYVIAVFFHTFNGKDLKENQRRRPTVWMVADIETGELIKKISCAESDFSKQSFEKMYSMDYPDFINPTPEEVKAYVEALYKLFDEIRMNTIESGEIDTKKYSEYMDKMLSLIPPAYRIFYEELSDLGSGITEEETVIHDCECGCGGGK